ncbi:peptidyl-tRNA hydrolase (plasmid) [Pseudomonas silesiensis]|uniref:peptidyl-tRNA hydrolase n=1 Tax=Pseudomonas silesiensis TaxID=1853130 RepID=UPI0030D016EB
MKKLKIAMRSDLNMRMGKMAAQSGHAAMKVLASHMRPSKDGLRLSNAKMNTLNAFLAAPDVSFSFVEDEAAVQTFLGQADDGQKVIDNGATEFNGIKTVTCAANGIFTEKWEDAPYDCAEDGSERKARQYFIFSRTRPLKKETVCALAAIGCLSQMAKMLEPDTQSDYKQYLISSRTNIAFDSWIKSGYAKIALCVVSDEALLDLQAQFDAMGSTTSLVERDGVKMLAVGPEFLDNISHLTGGLKLI